MPMNVLTKVEEQGCACVFAREKKRVSEQKSDLVLYNNPGLHVFSRLNYFIKPHQKVSVTTLSPTRVWPALTEFGFLSLIITYVRRTHQERESQKANAGIRKRARESEIERERERERWWN